MAERHSDLVAQQLQDAAGALLPGGGKAELLDPAERDRIRTKGDCHGDDAENATRSAQRTRYAAKSAKPMPLIRRSLE